MLLLSPQAPSAAYRPAPLLASTSSPCHRVPPPCSGAGEHTHGHGGGGAPPDGIAASARGGGDGRERAVVGRAGSAHEATSRNSDLVFMLAIGYSGRRDVAQACRGLADDARSGQLRPEDIDDAMLAGRLATSVAGEELSCPDLLIRTSGEQRLSNNFLWQSAYSELYFTDTMRPDFDECKYLKALASYQSRNRRFGKTKS